MPPVAAVFTITEVWQVAVPAGPVKVPANTSSPGVDGCMVNCPEGPTPPMRVMVPASALVLDQLTVTAFPTRTDEGAALMIQVGRVWADVRRGTVKSIKKKTLKKFQRHELTQIF